MSRTSTTLLRLGVPSLAAATLVAGIPAFLGTAQAAPIASITITPVDGSDTAAAGSCQAYEVRAAPLTPGTTTEGEKVNVVLTNLAGSGTADASFCTLPTRVNANTVRTPAAGTVVSTQGATGNTTANSVDQSSFVLGRGAAGSETTGRVFIGVTRNDFTPPGTVRVEAYGDTNGNNTFDVAAGEVQAQPRTTTFTSGGTTGSNPNQNAATIVEALTGTDAATGTVNNDSETAVQNEQRAFRVFVANATGDVLNGVTVNVTVSSPNAQTTRVFGTTDNNGVASGTIVFPNVDVAANSVVTFFVNQSDNATVTTDRDGGEPFDTVGVSVSQAPTARTIVLSALPDTATTVGTPAYQQNPAINPTTDGDRTFRAIVDNGSGATGSTVGTPVLFTVTGGSGDETVTPLNGTTVDNTVTTANTADSFVDFVVNDPTPNETAPLTVTALVRGQGTTATTTFTFAASVDEARNLDLTPETATSNVGAATPFTARVIDEDGNPVVGVPVTFNETGPGAFRNGNSTIVVFTNREGNAVAEVIAAIGEQGTQTITATQPATAETAKAQGNPFGVRAGNRSDTATNSVTGIQATASPTTSAGATTPATTPPSATNTPTGTPTSGNPTPSGTTCVNPVGISLSRAFITPGIPVTVTVNAPANSIVELQAYSRPSTEYRQVRQSAVTSSGTVSFDVTPGTNTRIFAACVGQTNSASASQVINVRTALSLTVVRNGTRNYTFQGRILPRRAGQLITLYRVTNDGTRVLTSQLKTDATGTYRINRRFTGSGTFGFLTRTGQTLTNAAGESNTPQTVAGVNAGRGNARPTAIF